jgi:hypothetical protein
VAGEEDRDAFLAVEALYEGVDLPLPPGVEAERRLVQKQNLRRMDEGAGDTAMACVWASFARCARVSSWSPFCAPGAS